MELLGLLLRIGCVFALLFAVLAVLKRTDGLRSARRTGVLQVLGTTRLGKGAALTVVRIGDAEYVLGVTDHTVTLLTPATPSATAEPAEAPAAVTAAGPVARTDFAATLGARLGALAARPGTATTQTPPTAGAFLRDAYRVARRRPAESTDLSTDAVTAALTSVRGDGPVVPAPRTSPEQTAPPALPPLALVPDGSATPTSRHALRRAVARTEALRHEEHPWTRSCRPTSRTSDLDAALL